MLTATPISPETLTFFPGEEMLLAPCQRARPGDVGEYRLLCRISEYLGDLPDQQQEVFGRPDWKHVYRLSANLPHRAFPTRGHR